MPAWGGAVVKISMSVCSDVGGSGKCGSRSGGGKVPRGVGLNMKLSKIPPKVLHISGQNKFSQSSTGFGKAKG